MTNKADLDSDKNKISTIQKILGLLAMFLYLIIWFIDRFLHLFLPHAPHKNLKGWAMDPTSLKLTMVRIVIFIIPIVIYNLIF